MREQKTVSPPIAERLIGAYPELSLSSQARPFLSEFEQGQTDGVSCWRSDAVERKPDSKIQGLGLFSTKDIDPREVIAIKPGHLVGSRTIKENSQIIKGSHQQIGPNEFLTGLTPEEVEVNLVGYNHSCDPNAKVIVVKGLPLVFIVAKKPIKKGWEITTDYSVSQSSNTHRIFICNCGSPDCRKIIQPGYDWLNPDFQKDHFDEFPYFIREEIEKMNDMPESKLNAQKILLYTLQSADAITLLADELARIKEGMEQIAQSYPGDKQLARIALRFLSKRDIKKYQDLLLKAAQLFAQVCPRANIEEMGIDRKDPKTVRKHLKELIAFARKIDFTFNR